MKWMLRGFLLVVLVVPVALVSSPRDARADVPYPGCLLPVCTNPYDYAAYLFLPPGVLPDDYVFNPANPSGGSAWKYQTGLGMGIVDAWQLSTGRPDVRVAVLDSGIRWRERQVAAKLAPNRGELPEPCPGWDCDGNGVVNPDDWAGVDCGPDVVLDHNLNGFLDGQDLIVACSDGVDDDANGFVDDIAGWDFFENDNDPFDDVDAGHGTGEAQDMVAEANDGGGFPGVAPSAMFVPLRVGDHFVALDSDFAQAVVYAVELGVDVVSEALGTFGATQLTQAAIDYAYGRGVPIIASAADEQSRHHNWPANAGHTIWVNSIRNGDGTFVSEEEDFRIQNGCTNHGGKAWVAISSTSCSSEATGRAAGITALLISHGKNLMDLGLLDPYPGLTTPFSAEEVRQLFRAAAEDVDRSGDPDLTPGKPFGSLLEEALSGPTPETEFRTRRFPTKAGWDPYTGYGRPDVALMLMLADGDIPPEADLTGGPDWFDVIHRHRVPIIATAAAVRTPGPFRVIAEVGCGVEPDAFTVLHEQTFQQPQRRRRLATWSPWDTAADCGFDPREPITDPDAHTVTLRLRVIDADGRVGEDRRTVAVHRNPGERVHRRLHSSGEGSPALADIDRDGVLDIVLGLSDGRVAALRGSSGRMLLGFPAYTNVIPSAARIAGVDAFRTGEVPLPREALLASVAADDLDGDGRVEIVAASTEGRVYVFDDHARLRAGFPVSSDPAFSSHERRDPFNDVDPGFASSPVLVDLDAPDGPDDLEIVAAGLDGYVYAWRADGTPVAGFPARLGDTTKLVEDLATGKWLPLDGSAHERLAKVISSAAAGDLDGDGSPEIVISTNEEYETSGALFSTDDSPLLELLVGLGDALDLGDFALDTTSRLYALQADGSRRSGFPVPLPMLAPSLLPTVATGAPGSPALASVAGEMTVAAQSAVGPVMLFDADGAPALGLGSDGGPRSLALDFPGGFPNIPDPLTLTEPQSFSFDAPFIGALGSPAFGDMTGDGEPEVSAPTGGMRALLDVAAPASQQFGDHQISVWNPADGSSLPGFPRVMDDMQFLSDPVLADVDGDGLADVVQGSGSYLVRAYRSDGSLAPGWPKFTHGWHVASPAAGDVDGDGRVEVVVITREGHLFIWDTPALATEAALPWPGFGRDRRNTRNLASAVSSLGPERSPFDALWWWIEAFLIHFL